MPWYPQITLKVFRKTGMTGMASNKKEKQTIIVSCMISKKTTPDNSNRFLCRMTDFYFNKNKIACYLKT